MQSPSSSLTSRLAAETGIRRRTGNLRRSCEACRSLKIRCVPQAGGMSVTEICQRCSNNGTACIFEQAIARPRRAKPPSKSRAKTVEEKIDGLVALISSVSDKENSSRVAGHPPILALDKNLSHNVDLVSVPLSSYAYQDVIAKNFLTIDEATRLLADFRVVSQQFPLILLHSQTTLAFLRRERPCFLLSLLTVCAKDDLQIQLEAEFRKVLAERLMINGEKSIDLLHGILTYVAWNHLYFNSAKQQVYQLSQIAAAMVAELGLGPLDESALQYLTQLQKDIHIPVYDHQYREIIEMMRTFLACYYVSSCVSLAIRKPTCLKHCIAVKECCRQLKYASTAVLDELLLCFIQLQELAEDIEQVFHYNGERCFEAMDETRIHVMVQSFQAKLGQIKDYLPTQAKDNSLIQRKCLHIQVYIHEIGLHLPKQNQTIYKLSNIQCCSWYSSLSRLNTAISCVRAAQNYIDKYVSLSQAELQHTVLFQETELLHSILVLAMATLEHIGVGDARQLHDLADIPMYLTALRDKMSAMKTLTDDGRDRRDYFWRMMQFAKHSLNWYSRYADSPLDCQKCDNGMSFMRIFDSMPADEVTQKDSGLEGSDMTWIVSDEDVWVDTFLKEWNAEGV